MTETVHLKIHGTEYRIVPNGSTANATVYYIRRGAWRKMRDPESIKRVVRYAVEKHG